MAESELVDILHYIALQDGKPETAEKVYFEIREKVGSHAKNNLPGRKNPLAPTGWYYIQYKRWLIFYQKHEQGIEVMRIIDGVRDLPRQLSKE